MNDTTFITSRVEPVRKNTGFGDTNSNSFFNMGLFGPNLMLAGPKKQNKSPIPMWSALCRSGFDN